jgi:hypothetical protein
MSADGRAGAVGVSVSLCDMSGLNMVFGLNNPLCFIHNKQTIFRCH